MFKIGDKVVNTWYYQFEDIKVKRTQLGVIIDPKGYKKLANCGLKLEQGQCLVQTANSYYAYIAEESNLKLMTWWEKIKYFFNPFGHG